MGYSVTHTLQQYLSARAQAHSVSHIALSDVDTTRSLQRHSLHSSLQKKRSKITGGCRRCFSPPALKTVLIMEEEFGIRRRLWGCDVDDMDCGIPSRRNRFPLDRSSDRA